MAYFWRLDAKFSHLCDAMYDDQAIKVSHLALLSVKGHAQFLACSRQMCLATGGYDCLHKVCIHTQNLDSILYKECIGEAESARSVPVFFARPQWIIADRAD
jgi:hypothetical protein